jgi:DNA-binding MarR family transcriptional regulator
VAAQRDVDLDSHVGVALRYAYQQTVATLAEELGDIPLTPMQVSVLARLHERGPTTQNRLGRSLGMEPANVRDVVQRLARRQLVALEQVPADRRALLVTVTPEGAELFATVWPRAEAANARTLSRLTPDERDALADILRRLGQDDVSTPSER